MTDDKTLGCKRPCKRQRPGTRSEPGLTRAFYERIGFDPSPLDAMTLMATIADLREAL